MQVSRRNLRRKNKDISTQTLMTMVVLVLVMTLLSASLYVHAFYGGGYAVPRSQGNTAAMEEKPVASGMATLQIIEPPEGST